ncbi:E3 ubiquitin-protein ligase TM129-like [Tubulanus polymorphus]|uniref:E3 ubiquitin-protein ligase TM129-like n=1 Tax=Tubulanus polymorphus TaxID=672921 RepID=UPI003DA4B19F
MDFDEFESEDIGLLEENTVPYMATVEVIYTLGYILFSWCLVAPPTEFVSAGFTIQNVLANYLGSEDLNFIYYHIKRTTATALVHSVIPLGYYFGLGICCPHLHLLYVWKATLFWKLYLITALIIIFAAAYLAYQWSRDNWNEHPIAKTLAVHTNSSNASLNSTSWRDVASSINVEFRRVDKFTTGPIGRRMIVTDSWIVKTTTYFVHVAHQTDIHLTLSHSEEHAITHDGNPGSQYLQISVVSANDKVEPFQIRLNSLEYSDLLNKLKQPIRNVRNIVVQQSLSERFVAAFKDQVEANSRFVKPASMEVETCIGCMQKESDVKLNKVCHDLNEGDCVQCYCRPMWCLECMGKWFASRQNQQEPDTWMSCKAPCPTCRSKFCMLDICKII